MSQFTLALNTSTIRPVSLMDKIRIAGETGYDAIELWNDDLTAYEQQGGALKDVKRALNAQGLSVVTVIALHGWLNTSGEAHQKAIEEAKRRMAQAAAVGSTYIIASPPREVADLKLGGKNYRELLELGRQYGVKPAMEFLGFVDGVNKVKPAWEVITAASHPDGTIVLDPFHIFRGGGEVDDMHGIPGDKIAVCHFNDVPASPPRQQQTDADRVYPGDGVFDLKRMVALLKEANYRGAISLELFNPNYWKEDPRQVAKIGLEKMKAVIGN